MSTKINRKILVVAATLAVVMALLIPTLPVAAGTGYSPITVWLGTSSYTVTADDWTSLLGNYTQTITGTYNTTNNFSYTGVPIYRILEFAFPQVASLTGYSVLTADATDYKVIYGPNVIDNTAVKGNNNLIIASSGTVNGVAATNLPRSACSTFTAGNRFNNNIATIKLQYAIQVPTPTNGTITPASGWYSGSGNPWTNSTPRALGVDYNASQTFNIAGNSGYHVATLTVDGAPVTPATSYTFSGVTANHTLAATFSNQNVSVYVSPTSQAVANSATFTVNMDINTDTASRGWQMNVSFDAGKMSANSVTEGTFLSAYAIANGGGTVSGGAATIDNVGGTITIPGYAITGAGTSGPTGTGILCTISFTAKAAINTFASITPTGVVVSDVDGIAIAGVTVTGGTVAIGNVPMPDLVVSALSAAKVDDTTYTITYTVTNQGNDAAAASTTSIVIDAGTPIMVACPALAAGASNTYTTGNQTLTSGSDTIVATADSAGVVSESNESNNSRTIIYSTAGDAGDTVIDGNIAAKLVLTAPPDIDPWNLVQGANSVSGPANVKCNSDWQLQVNDQNATTGHMTKWMLSSGYDLGTKLTDALNVSCQSSKVLSATPQTIATGTPAGQSGDSGQGLTIGFAQYVYYADPVLTGGYSYHIVITFTASVTI